MNNIPHEVDRLYGALLRKGSEDPFHKVFPEFCQRCANIPACRILEIGSREVRGVSRRRYFPGVQKYVGFDIHHGPGVDVVGDAHELSKHFPPDSFDAVFSISVFEHLAFPWKVVLEINRVLRVGGICYVSTHPVWPPHELPWDFWRFPIAGIKLLFSDATGFQPLLATEGLPARVHSLVDDPPTRGMSAHELSLGVALIAEKTKNYDYECLRWDVPLSSVLDTVYPIGNLEAVLRDKEVHISNLEQGLTEKEALVGNIEAAVRDKEVHIRNLEAALGQKEALIQLIYSGHGWRLLTKYFKIRDKLLQEGSSRRRVAKFIWNSLNNLNKQNVKKSLFFIKRYGFSVFLRKTTEKIKKGKASYYRRR